MEQLAINIINQFGYWGILILTALETICPVIPAEFILTLGGAATTVTEITRAGIVFFACIGEMIGATALYMIGRAFSEEKLTEIASKKGGKIFGISIEDISRTKEWFLKKGQYTVLFAKCIPVLGSLIAIPAGMANMNFFLFFLFSLVGISVWNSILVLFGATLKQSIDILLHSSQGGVLLKCLALVFVVCFVLVLCILIYDKVVKKQKEPVSKK